MSTLRLSIPARAEYLVFTRLVLVGISRSTEIDHETLADLKVAVTEVCSRTVRRAEDGGSQEIDLRYEISDDALTVALDEDQPDPDEFEEESLSEDAMGLAIVQALVDEIELFPGADGGRGTLSFTKKLR